MPINSTILKICKLFLSYFLSSLKSISTWILIAFNIFLLINFIKNNFSSSSIILPYIIQISLSIFLFGLLLFSLRSFKTMGKSYSGNGTKAGLLVFIIAILIFYGLAIYSILKVSSNFVDKIETSFFWSIAILLLSIVISFIVNFNTERKRLENTELIKTFFEPAGNIFPVYLSVILLAVFRGQAGVLIIIIKTFA